MSSYPVLKNRPIDQWKVTELKDELRKRRLPVKGLKEELVRRLFDSIQSEAAEDESSEEDGADATVDKATEDVLVDTPVNPEPEEQSARKGTTVSITEVRQEAVVHVTQEVAPPPTEVSQESTGPAVEEASRDNVMATHESPLNEAPTAKGDEQESVAGENSTTQEGRLHAESNTEPAVQANETIIANDVSSADVKSDVTSSEVKSDAIEASKIEKENTVSKPDKQVPEVSPDLGSQIKCESICSDDISNNKKNSIKDNLNANNFDLELEAKPEMVKPSSGTTSLGGDLQQLDDDKELVKDQSSLEEDSTANVDEVGSPEKLNLDRSSGDESMEEDVMEIKQVESNDKSDDLRRKTELSSEHVKEVIPSDSTMEGSSIDTKEVIAEEKPAASTEKRKLEAEETVAKTEPIKRQRRWTADSGKVPERQPLSQSASDSPKDIFQPALRRSFGRSDSTASGDSPKERIVPPPQKPATTSLRIDRFVRPFTLRAVQELLGKTGSVSSFWMDHIKTHCYVTYSSVEEAVATRNAVYNLQWPPNNGNHLLAEFVDPQEVKFKLEPPPPAAAAASTPISPATTPREAPSQQVQANHNVPRQAAAPREILPPPPPLMKPPTSDLASAREKLPPTPKKAEPPVVTLDDLFRKTQSSPRIYYLPLSEEEVATKLAAQGKGKRE